MDSAASIKFKIAGMDCAACVAKIETAVSRLDGVSNVKVGLQSETLTVDGVDEVQSAAIQKTVQTLGYRISVLDLSTKLNSEKTKPARDDHDGHDHDYDNHDDHGESIEGEWWKASWRP